MSMHPQVIGPNPEKMTRVARAAFPRGNPYLIMRDQLGTLYDDQDFAAHFSKRGRPAEARLPVSPGLRVPIHGRAL